MTWATRMMIGELSMPTTDLILTVDRIEDVTNRIRSFVLTSATGNALPAFEAGAHLRIRLPGGGDRSYSLISFEPEREPSFYRIAVLLEASGQGGSRYMHSLGTGEQIRATPPANHFRLDESAGAPVLRAGGIGITPIISMARELRYGNKSFQLHYCVRSRDQVAFESELRDLAGDCLTVHCDDDASRLDLQGLLGSLPPGTPVYVCGPTGLIDATIGGAVKRGWRKEDIHFERFAAGAAETAASTF